MNKQLLILAIGILAGASVAYFVVQSTNTTTRTAPYELAAPEQETAAQVANPAESDPPPPPVRRESPAPPAPAKLAPAPVSAWARLAEKYGTEKTVVSSKITSNLTGVISQGIELANKAALNSGSSSLAEAASKEILRNAAGQLALTEEQKQQASTVIQNAVNKRMAAVTDLTSAMSSEPEQIMELLLAGDALARKEISQEEYDRITQPTRAMLQNLAGFVGGRPGQNPGSQMLMDEETASQINAILTPEQQTKLAEMTASMTQKMQARQASRGTNSMPFQPGQIPIMELDRMDQAVASVRQMTEAARLMMEAMKGLKEANPGTTGNPTSNP